MVQPVLAQSSVADLSGNLGVSSAATSANGVSYSAAAFSVTINQASGQADPVNTAGINFTIVFSGAVGSSSFGTNDITQSGTATGITWNLSTADNITWTLTATSITGQGTVAPTIASNTVVDLYGNDNAASVSTDNTVVYDIAPPTLAFSSISPSLLASSLRPIIYGTASEQSIVTLYYDSGCVTSKSQSVSNTVFASPGIEVSSDVNANAATTVYGRAVDVAGNGSSCTSLVTYTHDGARPTVGSVQSSVANGFYKAGDVISIQVLFSESVSVSGSPQLTLETGATDAVAQYVSGSGSNTLVFTYTVSSGENTSDLDYASTGALSLNGGTIKDAAFNDAVLTLPA
jgi:hypothetical protein